MLRRCLLRTAAVSMPAPSFAKPVMPAQTERASIAAKGTLNPSLTTQSNSSASLKEKAAAGICDQGLDLLAQHVYDAARQAFNLAARFDPTNALYPHLRAVATDGNFSTH